MKIIRLVYLGCSVLLLAGDVSARNSKAERLEARRRALLSNRQSNAEDTEPLSKPGKVDVTKKVFVEGGTFFMGEDSQKGSAPQHTVKVDSFEMMECEVTVSEFNRVMAWAAGKKKTRKKEGWVEFRKGKKYPLYNSQDLEKGLFLVRGGKRLHPPPGVTSMSFPIDNVTWYGAAAYCNYRSEMEGLTPCYTFGIRRTCDFSANGYRLPTEAEWEYAAWGGVKGKHTRYSGWNSLQRVGWYHDNTVQKATITYPGRLVEGRSEKTINIPGGGSVIIPGTDDFFEGGGTSVVDFRARLYGGNKLPNELGLYDMSGNVSEWCNDWYEGYTSNLQTNPIGPARGKQVVIRGGGYESPAVDCTVYARQKADPETSSAGFRVVKSVCPKTISVQAK